jgi:hypothetical protein
VRAPTARGSSGTYAGVKLVGTQDSIIDFVSVDRGVITVAGQTAPTQTNALDIDSASAGNQITMTHGGTTGFTVGTAIKSGSDLSGGNQITIGSQGGTKTQAYATPFTPDPYVAETYEMTLDRQPDDQRARERAHGHQAQVPFSFRTARADGR